MNRESEHTPLARMRAWHPWRRLEDWMRAAQFQREVRKRAGQIEVKVTEDDQEYVVRAALPGARKEDMQVVLDSNRVDIIAAASVSHEHLPGASAVYAERYQGQQRRSLTLAHDIDDARASAAYRHGVLELHLPKRDAPVGTRIPVH